MVAVALFLSIALAEPEAPAQPVPFTQVHINDRFWTPRQNVNATATVWHCLEMLDKVGDLHNFELAAQGARIGYKGYVFNDSDTYKVLQGAADVLAQHPDPKLDKRVDEIIAMMAKAQQPNGYLDTYYEINEPDHEFTNLRDNHELYCAGHMFEAAAAHFNATGKRNLLNIAIKYANLLYQKFGPESPIHAYGGHPELELALVKLAKATGDHRYFDLAKTLVMRRGTHYFAQEHQTPESEYDGTYWIDDLPITQHKEIKGHAVRAAYLMSGATDVDMETHDPALTAMLGRVWRNAVEKRIFLTGGIGPSGSNEGFTVDYDLPNETAYQETCASIAMAMWGYRMGLLHADARYFDTVETSLYNAMLAGVSLDGTRFNYTNPLADRGHHHRVPWFDCACCPPNALRTIAELGGYAYAQRGETLFVNLYLPGSADLTIGGKPAKFRVAGDFPWDGHLSISPGVSGHLDLRLRVPSWCTEADLEVNSHPLQAPVQNGYFVIDRDWDSRDEVRLTLPMPVERIEANPKVKDDAGKLAVRRGPLIYCAEGVDQTTPLENLILPREAELKPVSKKELGGIIALEGKAESIAQNDWNHQLYQPATRSQGSKLTLIPYCYWDNRAHGPMEVWLPNVAPPARVGGPEVKAKIELSFLSGNAQPEGINDGIEPQSSGEQPNKLLHWWPHKGTTEWVAYRWDKAVKTKGIRVYFFDDTGRGECRLPAEWHLEKLDGATWTPVQGDFQIAKDKWIELNFPTIESKGLRLVVKFKEGWAAGIRQWRIVEDED